MLPLTPAPPPPPPRRPELSDQARAGLIGGAVSVVVIAVIAVLLVAQGGSDDDARRADRRDDPTAAEDTDDTDDTDRFGGAESSEATTTVSIPGAVPLPPLEEPVPGYPGQDSEDPCPTAEEVALATGLSVPPANTESDLPSKLHPDVVSSLGVQVAVTTCVYPDQAKVQRAFDPRGIALEALRNPPDREPPPTEVVDGREYVLLDSGAPPGGPFQVTTLAFDLGSHLVVVAVPSTPGRLCDLACVARLAELVVNRSS